jgi:parvulin-like peptidyl-prolyl isomerase
MQSGSWRRLMVALAAIICGLSQAASAQQDAPDGVVKFPGSETLAIVGDQRILRGDIMPRVRIVMQNVLNKMTPEERFLQREAIADQQDKLVEQLVDQEIEYKLLYIAFLQSLPADSRADAEERIAERVSEMFEDSLLELVPKFKGVSKAEARELLRSSPQVGQLAFLMDERGISTLGELDLLLKEFGTSIHLEQESFKERNLGRSYLSDSIPRNPEITRARLLSDYRENINKFKYEAQARWEQLTVYFDNHDSGQQAYAAIAVIGNEVLRGAKLAEVARNRSEESRAGKGGQHDWTTPGSLISKPLDKALFSLPVNRLSQIIEDDRGYHIIRVLERKEAGRTSFLAAQKKIKAKLRAVEQQQAIEKLVSRLRMEIPVWTIYDETRSSAQSSR